MTGKYCVAHVKPESNVRERESGKIKDINE